MTNRISKYDAGEWLALLVQAKLIDYGEPVVKAHDAMLAVPEICEFEESHESYD